MTSIQSYNQLHKTIDDLSHDFNSEACEPYMALDIASDVLNTNKQLRDSITEHYPEVKDQVVFLAEQIVG